MKAILLAGGEGTRLRPLSLLKPKPMLPFFDRPLLEHIVLLLRDCGFRELCMTLRYLPESIRNHFGDGADFGVSIEYRQETEPAGTAGSVLACRDFIGSEDVLIISGDAACAFDLRAMVEKHRLSGAEVTILTRSCASPLEYGLVLTEADGRIRSFAEKPGPEKVCTDQVNTGIYVISPEILSEIPRGRSYDFGAELFPRLLKEKRRLHTWQPEGYWNDVGTCEAYLQSCRDALSGALPLPGTEGIASRTPMPCWISPDAEVAEDAVLEAGTVVGPGSRVGGGCRISGSVLNGAVLEPGCSVENAILDRGVHLGRNTRLKSGCVLAEGVGVGAESLLRENLRFWPGVLIPSGSTVTESVACAARFYRPRFQPGARLRGEAVRELTPELLMRMGRGIPGGRTAAASDGKGYARLLAEAFLLGAGIAGGAAYFLDASLPALAAEAGALYGMDLTLFVREEDAGICLYLTGPEGLPAERKVLRALEASAFSDAVPAPPERCGAAVRLGGTEEAASAAILNAAEGSLKGLRLACRSQTLDDILRRAGAELVPPGEGVPRLCLSEDGFSLRLLDEEGRRWSWEQLLCALTKAELESGEEAVVLPYSAPAAAEAVAMEAGGTVYRLERDGGEALRRFRRRPWCRDGLTLAVRLLWLLRSREGPFSLSGFLRTLPEVHLREHTLQTAGTETAILRELARTEQAETVSGVRFRERDCTVTVRRGVPGELRILAESARAETAEEFCFELERRIRAME